MFFRRSILLLFISAILFISCTATDEENNFILRGTLFSEGGEPYSAIDIHIRNYLAPNGFVEPEGTTYTTNLSFTVEETSQVSLVVFKYAKQEILSTIVNEELPSGQHSVEFPSQLMSNGVFGYTLRVGEASSTGYFVVNRSDSSLIGVQPFTYTNDEGVFSIPIRELGIGELFSGAESQIFIEDSLIIVGIKDGELLGKARLEVDTESDNDVELVLK